MKHKMSSLVPLALVGLVGSAAFAAVDVNVSRNGLKTTSWWPLVQDTVIDKVELTNKTSLPIRAGVRVYTSGTISGGESSTLLTSTPFVGTYKGKTFANYDWTSTRYMPVGQGVSLQWQNGTGPKDAYQTDVLLKTGVCNQPLPYKDADPITLKQLEDLVKTPEYYDASYRYVDKLGLHGGDFSGGFIDTYYGETQALIVIPTATFTVNKTVGTRYNPANLKSPMSFMALTMGQEFFGMDMQWMFSVWTKETAFMSDAPAIANWHSAGNLWTNAEGAYGPGEVEATTYMSRALGYPKFFPYDPCFADPGSRDVATAAQVCGFTDRQFAARFMRADHTDPDSANIVNATLASGLTFWFNYDLLSNGTCLGFKQALLQSTDKRVGLCAMTPMYNLGINSAGILDPLIPGTNKNWSNVSCGDFAIGNGNYRIDITNVADLWEAEAAKSNAVFEDRWISLDDLRRFYFGENSKAIQPYLTNGATQQGGLMMHFDIGDAKKKEMWEELVAAFNLQAAHWGGGKISLRYDWLSNLRIAKKYLDLKRGQIQGEESADWIKNQSVGCTNDATGRIFDNRWPFAKFGALTDNGDFVAEVNAEEIDPTDRGIASVEWTVNDDWTLFSSQNVKPINITDVKKSSWQITIPAAEYQALTTGGQRTLYVRVNDSCGNSIVINTVLKGVPKPAISDASMYDYNGDGKADSLVFSGTDNGAAKFADFNDYSFDWYGSSKSGPKSDAKPLANNQFALGDPNLGAIDESQRTGDLTLKGSWGSIVKGISDKVGPVIMSASLRDTKNAASAKDTLTLSLNRSVSGLDTTKPSSFLDFFGQAIALNGKAPEKLSVKGNRVVAIYPLNSIKAYNPNKPSEVGDSVRLTPAGVVVGASNQQPVAANNKKTPIMLDFGPLHLLPGGLHGWFDTDGDGTMDMAQIQMDRPVDDYRRDQMKLTLSWIKTAKNKVFTKTFTGSDFSFSNDLVQIKFAKSDSISPNVTYFNASATDPLKRWGAAVLVQPGYDLTDSVKMADKMGPVVVRADLKRTSTPAIRPDLLDLTFSEPLDMKATKGTALYDFRIEGQVRTAKHDANLSWKASGSAMQIAFKPEHLLRPTVGDSVHFSLQGVDGVALDSAGNKPHNANPFRPITGKPVLQVAAVTFAGLTDANANQHPQAFDTVYVLDKATNVDTLAKEMGLSGFYARLTFNDVPAGVSNVSADSLTALRNLFSVRLQANIYSKLGEWVNSYDRSFNCKDIQKLAYNSDPRLTAACDPSILLSNREFTIFVPWNFRDANSRLVGTGVYLVDLKAAASSGGKTDLDKPISIGVYRKN